jgi:hypothetical protein
VIRVSVDAHIHRGWSADYQGLPPSDVYLMCEPDVAVPLLWTPCARGRRGAAEERGELAGGHRRVDPGAGAAFNELTQGMDVCLSKLPLGWNGAYRHFRHPLDYLGATGRRSRGRAGSHGRRGARLKGTNRMVVGICGDGDFLMGNTAVWTAAHYKLPCLFLVANNRSFYNDEMHQERVAKERGRPVENKWIGQRIDEPDIDSR